LRSHDTVNDQTGALLKLFDGSLGRWTEDAVDNQPKVRSSTQRPLGERLRRSLQEISLADPDLAYAPPLIT
jgi:hypothetical protein